MQSKLCIIAWLVKIRSRRIYIDAMCSTVQVEGQFPIVRGAWMRLLSVLPHWECFHISCNEYNFSLLRSFRQKLLSDGGGPQFVSGMAYLHVTFAASSVTGWLALCMWGWEGDAYAFPKRMTIGDSK